MELEITENNDNPRLNRQEVQIVIKHESDATPKRNQVIKSLSEKLKAKKELIIIDHLKNQYAFLLKDLAFFCNEQKQLFFLQTHKPNH